MFAREHAHLLHHLHRNEYAIKTLARMTVCQARTQPLKNTDTPQHEKQRKADGCLRSFRSIAVDQCWHVRQADC